LDSFNNDWLLARFPALDADFVDSFASTCLDNGISRDEIERELVSICKEQERLAKKEKKKITIKPAFQMGSARKDSFSSLKDKYIEYLFERIDTKDVSDLGNRSDFGNWSDLRKEANGLQEERIKLLRKASESFIKDRKGGALIAQYYSDQSQKLSRSISKLNDQAAYLVFLEM
jgi:hypothetical protein